MIALRLDVDSVLGFDQDVTGTSMSAIDAVTHGARRIDHAGAPNIYVNFAVAFMLPIDGELIRTRGIDIDTVGVDSDVIG